MDSPQRSSSIAGLKLSFFLWAGRCNSALQFSAQGEYLQERSVAIQWLQGANNHQGIACHLVTCRSPIFLLYFFPFTLFCLGSHCSSPTSVCEFWVLVSARLATLCAASPSFAGHTATQPQNACAMGSSRVARGLGLCSGRDFCPCFLCLGLQSLWGTCIAWPAALQLGFRAESPLACNRTALW